MPAPPLGQLVRLTPSSATMSSSWGHSYRAALAIDEIFTDMDRLILSLQGSEQWVAIRVPDNSDVGYVGVWSRPNNGGVSNQYQVHLNKFEVWLAPAAAAPANQGGAFLCGTDLPVPAEPYGQGPFFIWCGARIGGPTYVIVKRGPNSPYPTGGMLNLAEVEAYDRTPDPFQATTSTKRLPVSSGGGSSNATSETRYYYNISHWTSEPNFGVDPFG
jgi:hypothetical protein